MFVNLTAQTIKVYGRHQFKDFEEIGDKFYATGTEASPALELPTLGEAKVLTKSKRVEKVDDVEMVSLEIEKITGIPEVTTELVVVTPEVKQAATQLSHRLAGSMVTPWGVVYDKEDRSQILGVLAFAY